MANIIQQISNEPKGLTIELSLEIHQEIVGQLEDREELNYSELLESIQTLDPENVINNPGMARNHAVLIAAYAARLAQNLDSAHN